jgi:antitoxin ParD1/3/4
MTVTLTAEQEKFIAERMNRAGYSSPEKVLEEGLKLIQAKEEYQRRLAELRRELQIGIDQINRGEVLNGDEVFDEILAENGKRPRIKA